MSEVAIRCEGLSKQYRLGERETYKALRDVIADAAGTPFRRLRAAFQTTANGNPGSTLGTAAFNVAPGTNDDGAGGYSTFWALDDVSFEIEPGEVVGVIGRNGAGKSTLLKILSRITKPTRGHAEIHGRVGSLLEVGTGFHPELSGRENIYLNAAILGMRKAEVVRKFDDIVAFAETEKFIDTPVKRYSSGMYMRLAFAVAAHLDPEILMVDEVLAVGDAQFQKKCLGKMGAVAREGRTVLFVSHNLSSIQQLCTKALLLQAGHLDLVGAPAEVCAHYLSDAVNASKVDLKDWRDRIGTGEARLTEIEIDTTSLPNQRVAVGSGFHMTLTAQFHEPVTDPCFGVIVNNSLGEPVLDLRSKHGGLTLPSAEGRVVLKFSVRNLGLYPGRYFLSPWIADSTVKRDIDFVRLCCILDVDPAPGPHGDLKLDPVWGKYWVQSEWEVVDQGSWR